MPNQWLWQYQDANIRYCIEHRRAKAGLEGRETECRKALSGAEWSALKEGKKTASEPPEDGPCRPEVNADFNPHLMESENVSEKREN